MRVCLSPEAKVELGSWKSFDRDTWEALDACIEMLKVDVNEFEGEEGFSIKRIGSLFRRGIRLYRVKYERYTPGLRILFFSIPRKDCVFVTGIHARGDLGHDYDLSKAPFTRARTYWAKKDTLCS